MQTAMESRAVIEQAKGIIMGERRCTPAGGRVLAEFGQEHVVMADPEGNEFCVAVASA